MRKWCARRWCRRTTAWASGARWGSPLGASVRSPTSASHPRVGRRGTPDHGRCPWGCVPAVHLVACASNHMPNTVILALFAWHCLHAVRLTGGWCAWGGMLQPTPCCVWDAETCSVCLRGHISAVCVCVHVCGVHGCRVWGGGASTAAVAAAARQAFRIVATPLQQFNPLPNPTPYLQ